MITGRQIREARALLGLSPSGLAVKVRRVTTATVKKAESSDPGPALADSHLKAIQRTLETLGIEFVRGSDGEPGVRLRKGDPA